VKKDELGTRDGFFSIYPDGCCGACVRARKKEKMRVSVDHGWFIYVATEAIPLTLPQAPVTNLAGHTPMAPRLLVLGEKRGRWYRFLLRMHTPNGGLALVLME
jgi:hypothetical protein